MRPWFLPRAGSASTTPGSLLPPASTGSSAMLLSKPGGQRSLFPYLHFRPVDGHMELDANSYPPIASDISRVTAHSSTPAKSVLNFALISHPPSTVSLPSLLSLYLTRALGDPYSTSAATVHECRRNHLYRRRRSGTHSRDHAHRYEFAASAAPWRVLPLVRPTASWIRQSFPITFTACSFQIWRTTRTPHCRRTHTSCQRKAVHLVTHSLVSSPKCPCP